MTNKTWTVALEEDPDTGELILPFPFEFMEENDWREGDTLDFKVTDQSCIVENLSWQDRQKDKVVES